MTSSIDRETGAQGGTNRVRGLAQFRARWDEQTARVERQDAARNARSTQGHINLAGSAACYRSAIFTPADPEFVGSLEPGVRELVLFLVQELQCITYSSCEGHPASDGAAMRQRHVGILPRDDVDRGRLQRALQDAAEATRATAGAARIEIRTDAIATEGPSIPCIDLVFMATTPDWTDYAQALPTMQGAFLARLGMLTRSEL